LKHLLIRKAERKQQYEEQRDRIHHIERSYGMMHRTIRLPRNPDVDTNGELCVRVRKLVEVPEPLGVFNSLNAVVLSSWCLVRVKEFLALAIVKCIAQFV
jgi:hypothetical protein